MPSRLRLAALLAGGLYLGPFLAGWSRHPGWAVGAFGALLILWSALYRTGPWPRRAADLARPGALVPSAVTAAALLLLAGLCFAAGRGLSVAVGTIPLPLGLPLALSALSLLAALLLLPPARAAAMDAFLDDALAQLQALPGAGSGALADDGSAERIAQAARTLAALPPGTGPEAMARRLAALGRDAGDPRLLDALEGHRGSRAARLGAVLRATDPDLAPGLCWRSEPARAFALARGDAALLRLLAERGAPLLHRAPDLWGDFPTSEALREAALAAPEAGEALRRLAEAVDAHAPPDAAAEAHRPGGAGDG